VGASVGSFSEVVAGDASIGTWSDVDDEDSCFGACLATNRDYDGPVNCSMEGSGNVPIVDCTFLQHEQMQSSSHNGDAAATHTSTERDRKGGWTYVGWLRTGTKTNNQSDGPLKDIENITSLMQSPHISYLLRSNPRHITDNNVALQHLCLCTADLL